MGWEELSDVAEVDILEAEPAVQASKANSCQLSNGAEVSTRVPGERAEAKNTSAKKKASTKVQTSYLGAGRAAQLKLALKVASLKHARPVVFYGPAGIGKSTMLQDVRNRVKGVRPLVSLSGYQQGFNAVLKAVAIELGVAPEELAEVDTKVLQKSILVKLDAVDERRPVMVLFDDAQELKADAMASVLDFCEHHKAKISIMLCVDTFDSPVLRADLRQRKIYGMALKPLALTDMAEYVAYKAMPKGNGKAGLDGDAMAYILDRSKGVPERIDLVRQFVQTKISEGEKPWLASSPVSEAPSRSWFKRSVANAGVIATVMMTGLLAALGLWSDPASSTTASLGALGSQVESGAMSDEADHEEKRVRD